jgi:hypothetical protein
MKRLNWQVVLGLSLVLTSAVIYVVHYLIFKNAHDIFFYMIMDIAFIPPQILLVTYVLNRLLSHREKEQRLEKLNMVIGVFFSEVGTRLLTYFSDMDPHLERIRKDLITTDNWSGTEFANVQKRLKTYDYEVDIDKVDLNTLKSILSGGKNFLVMLMENPNLLEHESFTEHLRAVFHLAEELACREDVEHLPDADRKHLAGDIRRAYRLMVHQWLDYMRHLKDNYPYLFSLAMRLNPFDQNSSPIVK